jgi:uncharacterized protein
LGARDATLALAIRSAMRPLTLDQLRRYALARTFFRPTTLLRAIEKLGFVQADPIRAPARAQDLTLRQRVKNYHAGDLERRYPKLAVEEDFFINYGFVPRAHHGLMHPRTARTVWSAETTKRARAMLEFIRERGNVHPREVEAQFAHGNVRNYWGGSSNATTHLLDAMHYRGLLRVVRRDNGTRVYALQQPAERVTDRALRSAQLDALVDIVVAKYAPLPAASLAPLIYRLRHAVPQWTKDLKATAARAKQRLAHAQVAGVEWYWPAADKPAALRGTQDDTLRLLAPFDPAVWDRRRFELFWGWAYRFEAYTPAAKRKLGYYALPMLWREQVLGWANLSWKAGELGCELGFVRERPSDPAFTRALDAELARLRTFLE